MNSSLNVSFPWPSSTAFLVLRGDQRAYSRHGKGTAQGGQFRGKDVSRNQPEAVQFAQESYNQWNRKRVKLAKLERRIKDEPASGELDKEYFRLRNDVTVLKRKFQDDAKNARRFGFKIDSRGKWKNRKGEVEESEAHKLAVSKIAKDLSKKNDDGKNIETAHIIDRDGKTILKLDGSKPSIVEFTDLQRMIIQNSNGGTMVHDHPSGKSLSRQDVITSIALGLDKVIAVGRANTGRNRTTDDPDTYHVYTMDFNGNVPKLKDMLMPDSIDMKAMLVRSYSQALSFDYRTLMPKYQRMYEDHPLYADAAKRGELHLFDGTQDAVKAGHDVDFEHGHEAWKITAEKFNWTYTREEHTVK